MRCAAAVRLSMLWVPGVVAALFLLLALPASAESDVIIHETAHWTVTPAGRMPAPDADWEQVTLPDSMATLRHEGSYYGDRPHGIGAAPLHWYRIALPALEADEEGLAIFLPRFADRGRIYLNGQLFARSFVQGDRIEHGWNRPWFATLPGVLLQEDEDNELLLALDAPYTGVVHLSRPRIGSAAELRAAYRSSYRWRIRSAEASTWILLSLSAFGIGIWLVRREELLHLLLGLGAGAFSLRMLHYFVAAPAIPVDLFWWISVVSIPWAMFFLYLFSFRYYRINRPYLEYFLMGLALLSTVAIMPGIGLDAFESAGLVYLLLVPVGAVTATLLVSRAWQQRGFPQVTLAAGFLICVLLAIYDLSVMLRWLPIEYPYLMPVGAVLLCFGFALALAARYVESLEEVASVNTVLEARVRERQQALEESHTKMRGLATEQAKAEERQRLMREIHDGIGANLVTALAAVEASSSGDSDTARTLRAAIADLKLTIDSLEPVEGDLLSLLGNLRYRLTPQLRRAGIAVEWEVTPLPSIEWMQPPHALHVLRIAQETFGNVMQHAAASSVRVATGVTTSDSGETDGVWLEIIDDGVGLAKDVAASGTHRIGRGISNMKDRARSLGGNLEFGGHAPRGTRVRLWLPLHRAAV